MKSFYFIFLFIIKILIVQSKSIYDVHTINNITFPFIKDNNILKFIKKEQVSILIPTIRRSQNQNYLETTLKSIEESINSLIQQNHTLSLNIIIINTSNFLELTNDPFYEENEKLIKLSTHNNFYDLKKKYENFSYFQFYTLLDLVPKNSKLSMKYQSLFDLYGNIPQYSHIVPKYYYITRRQTLTVAILAEIFHDSSDYLVYHEDDMLFCSSSLDYLISLLNSSIKYHKNNFSMIKYSYGMNGILIPTSDAAFFSFFMIKYSAYKPVDHLTTVYANKEVKDSIAYLNNRFLISSKYFLFNHIGTISTLRNAPQSAFPRCFQLLMPGFVFPVEAFNRKCFQLYDFSPCTININNSEIDVHEYYTQNSLISGDRPLLYKPQIKRIHNYRTKSLVE